MQNNANGMMEELLWMIEQDEFGSLKERIQSENKMRLWRQETRDEFLDRWGKERRRAARRKERFEKTEEERIARIDAIRIKHREEATQRVAERELQVSMDLSISSSKNTTGASTELKTNDKSALPLNTCKELPNTPSGTKPMSGLEPNMSSKDGLRHPTKLTPQLYTGSDILLQETNGKPDISSSSVTVSNRSGHRLPGMIREPYEFRKGRPVYGNA
jgi:hypothetical protein